MMALPRAGNPALRCFPMNRAAERLSIDQADATVTGSAGSGPVGLGPVGEWLGGEWPMQAADTIERVVSNVKRKTTGPAIVVSRALVYGIVAATFGVMALILGLVGVVRALDALLPTWAVHLVIGGVLSLAGLFCWSRRTATSS